MFTDNLINISIFKTNSLYYLYFFDERVTETFRLRFRINNVTVLPSVENALVIIIILTVLCLWFFDEVVKAGSVAVLHLQLFTEILMTGIAIFSMDITTVSLSILISLCVEISESTVAMLKMGIITILPSLYVIIGIITFGINNITVLSLFTSEIGRANIVNIINITIKRFDINKIIILLSIYVNIIIF